jgi:tripeptidyl-peptidase-1
LIFADVETRVPDVSAIVFAEFIWNQQIVNSLLSTEYSASIFASMVALLTNERIAAGKPGLGFLNPLIYANPGAFKDLKTGTRVPKCLLWNCLRCFPSASLREQSGV